MQVQDESGMTFNNSNRVRNATKHASATVHATFPDDDHRRHRSPVIVCSNLYNCCGRSLVTNFNNLHHRRRRFLVTFLSNFHHRRRGSLVTVCSNLHHRCCRSLVKVLSNLHHRRRLSLQSQSAAIITIAVVAL